MRLADLDLSDVCFRTSEDVFATLEHACTSNPDLATFEVIGTSEKGRPIAGVTMGHGPRTVTLVAGAHADEPVGPETLRTFVIESLAARDWGASDGGFAELFEQFTFKIVPHVNPDAETANQPWVQAWPDLRAFLRHRLREQPGRDIEFGYPVMRAENRAVSRFLFGYAPIALHASLHGMAFSEGALLLIERHWAEAFPDRLAVLQRSHLEAAKTLAGLEPHDQDRSGDKGFRYLGPGFWSTPEGTAMQAYFLREGEGETASKFFLSSMELARIAGYDAVRKAAPLCLVTELPLWLVRCDPGNPPGVPLNFQAFREVLPSLTAAAQRDVLTEEELDGARARFGLKPVDLRTAVRLQLHALDLGLAAVS
ncbi:MAG: M14 family zinc carboxypeptidase [Bacteroidota bacterium]